MKKEELHLTPQKYKGSEEIIDNTNSYKLVKWKIQKKKTNYQKCTHPKTELVKKKNRKYERLIISEANSVKTNNNSKNKTHSKVSRLHKCVQQKLEKS